MLIKILYILGIFLVVRLIVNGLKTHSQIQDKIKNQNKEKRENEDIIDAEYKVVDEDRSQ